MPLTRDLGLAWSLARRAVRSRSSRRRLERDPRAAAMPAPGTVRVAVYFADTAVNMYQIRQWYAPLARLAETFPVAIVVRSPGTMVTMLDESPVPLVYARKVADLEDFVAAQPLAMTLYVNQNAKNFQMMRYGRMWHVFVNHGESDKMYMTTNQFKAYDYAFVAGDAAKDRLAAKLWDYDLDKRAVPIGRPQADHFSGEVPYPDDDRLVVLYAPTWEGDRSAAAYGSVASHGVSLVTALLQSPRHRVVYRPHPRSGVVDHAYGQANKQIKAAIAAANDRDPGAQHIIDTGADLGWQLSAADVAIVDISAMVYDRLASGRPLMVTRPQNPLAAIDTSGYLSDCEWLTAADTAGIVETLDELMSDDTAEARLRGWVEQYFGDPTPGAATARFHGAIGHLLEEWDRFAALHAGDADVDGVADFEDVSEIEEI